MVWVNFYTINFSHKHGGFMNDEEIRYKVVENLACGGKGVFVAKPDAELKRAIDEIVDEMVSRGFASAQYITLAQNKTLRSVAGLTLAGQKYWNSLKQG
jgi:hypothetical protein